MAHHGDDAEIMAKMAELFNRSRLASAGQPASGNAQSLGETGQFPEGKLNDDDEGEIRIAIGSTEGKVVIEFGKPVAWIGFTPEQARLIADSLVEQAGKIDGHYYGEEPESGYKIK